MKYLAMFLLILITACTAAPDPDVVIMQRLRHAEETHQAEATRVAERHTSDLLQARVIAANTERLGTLAVTAGSLLLVFTCVYLILFGPRLGDGYAKAKAVAWMRDAVTLERDAAGSLPGLLTPAGMQLGFMDANALPTARINGDRVAINRRIDMQESHRNAKQTNAATAITRNSNTGITTGEIEEVSGRIAGDWFERIMRMPQMQAAGTMMHQQLPREISVPVVAGRQPPPAPKPADTRLISRVSTTNQESTEYRASARGLLMIAELVDARDIRKELFGADHTSYGECMDYLRAHNLIGKQGTRYVPAQGVTGEDIRAHVAKVLAPSASSLGERVG